METGKVKTLVRDRKFGFIAVDGKPDVFFHEQALNGVAYESLQDSKDASGGTPVTFDEVTDQNGRKKAENVKLAQ